METDVVAHTCISETFLSEIQASLSCLKKHKANPDVGFVHAVIPTLRSWKPEEQEFKASTL